MNKLTLV